MSSKNVSLINALRKSALREGMKNLLGMSRCPGSHLLKMY